MNFRSSWPIVSLVSLIAATAPGDDLDSGLPEIATDSATASAAPDAADPVAPDTDDLLTMHLSLEESIQLALQNNLDVEVQRFTPLIAGEQETQAWGAYDPEFFAEFGYSDIDEPISFTLQGEPVSASDSYNGFGGFRGLLPYLGSE